MTGAALLDVNVLVALFDPDHVHHEAAHGWFATSRSRGWATCPLTENGLVRILSNPAYAGIHETSASVATRLALFRESGHHTFWPDDLSVTDERHFAWTGSVTHGLLTDVYLLALATHHGGRLATFDRRIPLAPVHGADRGNLEVIPA